MARLADGTRPIGASSLIVSPEEASRPSGSERRLETLDGLRGLMTIMVIVSHYFGELPHGIHVVMFGWIAVNMFFVLSGFLIGRLILERRACRNFFVVFYVRRFCRIIPAYIIAVLGIAGLMRLIDQPWLDASVQFPLWSYLSFTQGLFMVATQSIGAHWLAPTWTLGVEEHFYLLVPALIVFTPPRWLVPALLICAAGSFCLRLAIYFGGVANPMLALALLPGLSDVLVCGLLAAIAVRTAGIDWRPLLPLLRTTPVVALAALAVVNWFSGALFGLLSPLLVAIASTSYLLCIYHNTPEAKRYHSKALQFIGNNGYCLYLTHLPVLGLMHGLLLGTQPDLSTLPQWLVTLAALPVCLLVGWGMTRLIEEPLTRYGRTWRWSR